MDGGFLSIDFEHVLSRLPESGVECTTSDTTLVCSDYDRRKIMAPSTFRSNPVSKWVEVSGTIGGRLFDGIHGVSLHAVVKS